MDCWVFSQSFGVEDKVSYCRKQTLKFIDANSMGTPETNEIETIINWPFSFFLFPVQFKIVWNCK